MAFAKVEWTAYKPEDINWEARSRAKAWERNNSPLEETMLGKPREKDKPAITGIVFAVFMAILLILTYINFF